MGQVVGTPSSDVISALVISDVVRSPDVVIASPDLLRNALLDAGCTDIVTASSVEAALPMLGRISPDLVILDTLEPPSFETYRKLLVRVRTAPVLAIVAETRMQQAFDAGVHDCVSRPIRRAELIARVRAAVRDQVERTRRSRKDRKLTDEMRVLQREKHDLERVVCVDSLTGVANRRHALALLEAEWKRSTREGTPLSIVMIDLDYFHAYNEQYGHPGGDACLRRVTAEIALCLRRPSDYVGRYGGEEFIAVLANTDAAGARLVADRVRAAVEGLAIPHAGSDCSEVATISVGFASIRPVQGTSVEALLEQADRALLTAKAAGRNCVFGDAPQVRPRPQPWRRYPVVIADPWFANRIPPFLATTREDLGAVRAAAEESSFDRVRAQARRLRAGALAHGIERIAELAGMLEHAARLDDQLAIARAVSELESYVQHVQIAYRRPHERSLGHSA